jgi:hypothetical protein
VTNTERIQANNAELREAIEMAETLPEAGGGGVSVQADWNQTDETAADFIKNKPFGATEAIFVEEQSYVSNDVDGAMLTAIKSPSIGSNVTVVHDNVIYNFQIVSFQGFPAVGNQLFLGGEDTGEPFFAFWGPGMFLVIDIDNGVNHTFKCTGESIEKLPEKYYERDAVVFYTTYPISGDNRLYTNLVDGVVATKADLEKAVNKPVQINMIDIWLCSPIFISAHPEHDYGFIGVIFPQTTEIEYLFTAEYTPE